VVAAYVPGPSLTNYLLNPGFESKATSWSGQYYHPTTLGDYVDLPPICGGPATITSAHGGSYYSCLGGHAKTTTDIVAQTVAVPASAYSGKLSFWLQIRTQEKLRCHLPL